MNIRAVEWSLKLCHLASIGWPKKNIKTDKAVHKENTDVKKLESITTRPNYHSWFPMFCVVIRGEYDKKATQLNEVEDFDYVIQWIENKIPSWSLLLVLSISPTD